MSIYPLLDKENSEAHDIYGVVIYYLTGKREEFELSNHMLHHETKTFEFVTKDDVWHLVPLNGVLRIEFDKRFSKIMGSKNDRWVKNNNSGI